MGKGGLGSAVGAISIPILSFVIHPVQAAAIILPILCVMDIFAFWKFRNNFSVDHLAILLPAGIAGIVIASVLMGNLEPGAIRLVIGITIIWFCLDSWFRDEVYRIKLTGRASGYLPGVVSGFTSTQIHASGVPASMYLLPQKH